MVLTESGVVAFELEEFTAIGHRLEVTGRWLGVRGRRFVRPSLSAEVGGRTVRALAELDHKPWAPDDESIWIAAFEWSGEWRGVETFELAVAPDIAVPVPRPGHEATAPLEALPATDDGDLPKGDGRQPGGRPDQAAVELKAALADRNAAIEECNTAIGERNTATRARDAAIEERDAATRARDRAIEDRDAAIQERETASERGGAASHERDAAISERDAAISERDRARAERAEALQARDAAIRSGKAAGRTRDAEFADREQLARALREAHHELARVQSELAATRALPLPPVTTVGTVQRFGGASERWRGGVGRTSVLTRALAVAALLAFVLILLVILTGT